MTTLKPPQGFKNGEHLSVSLYGLLRTKISNAPHAFFFLDYDGTLAAIAPTPDRAVLLSSTRRVLEALALNPRFSVGFISGRQVEELKSVIQIDGAIYAGNHGLELEGPDFRYTHAKAKGFRRVLQEVGHTLGTLPLSFPGTFLEDKGATLTYHYRLMNEEDAPHLLRQFQAMVAPWVKAEKIKVMESKKALEIRPNFNWNKGSAVRWILLHEDPESLPVYIGDDRTDEAAFKALADRGITVRVGPGEKSAARYYVKDVGEVEQFLSYLIHQFAP